MTTHCLLTSDLQNQLFIYMRYEDCGSMDANRHHTRGVGAHGGLEGMPRPRTFAPFLSRPIDSQCRPAPREAPSFWRSAALVTFERTAVGTTAGLIVEARRDERIVFVVVVVVVALIVVDALLVEFCGWGRLASSSSSILPYFSSSISIHQVQFNGSRSLPCHSSMMTSIPHAAPVRHISGITRCSIPSMSILATTK